MDWDGIGSLNGILLRAPLGGVNNLFDSKRSQKTHKYLQVLERAELAEENAPISFLNRDCKPCRLVAWLHLVSCCQWQGDPPFGKKFPNNPGVK